MTLLALRLIAAGVLVAALTTAYFGWRGQQREIGREEVRAELKAAAEAQTERNRDLQRFAEQRLHALTTRQSKFLAKTAQEIRHAAAPLASCPVPDDVVVRFNAARACASGDSAAACGPGDGVPAAR